MRKQKFWIQRISHIAELTYPLLEAGYLSIGYVDFALVDNYLDNLKKGTWAYLEKEMQSKWGALLRNRHQLWRFLMEMKKGDYVLVPTAGNFSIYELLEDDAIPTSELPTSLEIKDWSGKPKQRDAKGFILKDDGGIYDLGFTRSVKLVAKDISRYDYADTSLTSRLKVRQSNVEVPDLEVSILNALKSFTDKKPINFRYILTEARQAIRAAVNQSLQPDKFERLVRWYFKKLGATSVDIPAKNAAGKQGEEDADVVATFDLLKTIFYVQVKHHSSNTRTGSWAVQQINAMGEKHRNERMDDGYNKIYWVISSADDFNDEAIHQAQQNSVQLFSGDAFADMLLDVGLHNINEAFRL